MHTNNSEFHELSIIICSICVHSRYSRFNFDLISASLREALIKSGKDANLQICGRSLDNHCKNHHAMGASQKAGMVLCGVSYPASDFLFQKV